MLELTHFLLTGWEQSEESFSIRRILSPDHLPLGQVRFTPASTWWLLGGFGRWEVLETEDASLLFTIRRPWGFLGLWKLVDAEEDCVGEILVPSLLDRDGYRCGWVDVDRKGTGRILTLHNRVLADFEFQGEYWRFSFAVDLGTNPFLRMLVFGGALLSIAPPSPTSEIRARAD